MRDGDGCFAVCLAAFVGLLLGCWLGDVYRQNTERAAAIKAGAGNYTCDAATGETVFVYGAPKSNASQSALGK